MLDDLLLVQESLKDHRGRRVAMGAVQRLIRKVRLFGLHLVPLEVREDAGLHAAALDEIFNYYSIAENYSALPEEEKQALLTAEIRSKRPLFPNEISVFTETTQSIVRTWQMIGQAHQRYDPIVIDTVIASMSRQPSDALAMLLFAREVGIDSDVYIVPLFETIDDLYHSTEVMSQLFSNVEYRRHLVARAGKRGIRQQVMIGYSDSGKRRRLSGIQLESLSCPKDSDREVHRRRRLAGIVSWPRRQHRARRRAHQPRHPWHSRPNRCAAV